MINHLGCVFWEHAADVAHETPTTFLDLRGIVITSCICHAYSCSISLGNVASSHRVISLLGHSCLALSLHHQCPWILPLLCSLPEVSPILRATAAPAKTCLLCHPEHGAHHLQDSSRTQIFSARSNKYSLTHPDILSFRRKCQWRRTNPFPRSSILPGIIPSFTSATPITWSTDISKIYTRSRPLSSRSQEMSAIFFQGSEVFADETSASACRTCGNPGLG